MTLAVFLSDDERLEHLRHEAPVGWLDESLVEEWFSLAEPEEVVSLLTCRIGPHLSNEVFKRVFDRTLAASSDIDVISGLMFVAGLYLDRHPDAFLLPRNLADKLLASDDLDHRLAGIKAFRHSMVSLNEIFAQIVAALNRDDCEEKWAGLSQLEQLLEEKGRQLAEATQQNVLQELRNVLTQLADTTQDTNIRRAAAHCRALLGADGSTWIS